MTTEKAVRRTLPENLRARSHDFNIAGHEGTIVVSLYSDGTPGRIMITMFRDGATVQGLLHGLGITLSLALQYGVPIHDVMAQFKGLAFGASGWTKNPKIGIAKSVLDYVAQWFEYEFPELMAPMQVATNDAPLCRGCFTTTMVLLGGFYRCPKCDTTEEVQQPARQEVRSVHVDDCPPCTNCGSIMAREDNGYRCSNCNATAGLG